MEATEFLIRVAVGTGLAALLGLEREVSGKAAGIRTHALVGLGSALFTVLSLEAFGVGDPSRVAAQIVSGIGFLGAGAIFRSGALIKGLTTAAGLWAAAAVGMAAGSGFESWAALGVGVALSVLLVLSSLKGVIDRFRMGVGVSVTVAPASCFLEVREHITSLDPTVEMEGATFEGEAITLHMLVASAQAEMLMSLVSAIPHVTRVGRTAD